MKKHPGVGTHYDPARFAPVRFYTEEENPEVVVLPARWLPDPGAPTPKRPPRPASAALPNETIIQHITAGTPPETDIPLGFRRGTTNGRWGMFNVPRTNSYLALVERDIKLQTHPGPKTPVVTPPQPASAALPNETIIQQTTTPPETHSPAVSRWNTSNDTWETFNQPRTIYTSYL